MIGSKQMKELIEKAKETNSKIVLIGDTKQFQTLSAGGIFEQLQKGIEKDELIAKMISEYDVTKEKASADIDIFINKLKDANVFE